MFKKKILLNEANRAVLEAQILTLDSLVQSIALCNLDPEQITGVMEIMIEDLVNQLGEL